MTYAVPTQRTVELYDELRGRTPVEVRRGGGRLPVPLDVRIAVYRQHFAAMLAGTARRMRYTRSSLKPRRSMPVRQVESGRVYASVQAAHLETGLARSTLSRAAKTGRQTPQGHWEYVTAAASRGGDA